jgi:uncharacterized protein YaiL (DUF2058 family)
MQDLRDKLLKAGLVDKKQARKARTDSRRDHKKKGGKRTEVQRQHQQDQQQRFEAKLADQRSRARERQDELNREQAEREQESRIRDFIRAHSLRFKVKPSSPKKQEQGQTDRPFYFMGRDRKIRRLYPGYELAHQLGLGRVAIVEVKPDLEHDQGRDFALMDAAAALRLEELDAGRILFWNKTTDEPPGDLPTYGSGSGSTDADPKAR